MQIHLYDTLNKNKIGTLHDEDFSSLSITHNIDDMSSCEMKNPLGSKVDKIILYGLESFFVEDDNGDILFGGVCTDLGATQHEQTMRAYDHRWIFGQLVLDAPMTLLSSQNVLDVFEMLVNIAKGKRNIPIIFDRDNSAINSAARADLYFEVGDSILSCMQKIIEASQARWAIRYGYVNGELLGRLIVRSIRGVTPEGVGIARSLVKSEDGEVVTLFYGEGDPLGNLESFDFKFSATQYVSTPKIGTQLPNATGTFTAENVLSKEVTDDTKSWTPNEWAGFDVVINPAGNEQGQARRVVSNTGTTIVLNTPFDGTAVGREYSLAFYTYRGTESYQRSESYRTDYRVNSQTTAKAIGFINAMPPQIEMQVAVSPKYTRKLNCGDRVSIRVVSSLLVGLEKGDSMARIDGISYSRGDGYWTRSMLVNLVDPKKRNDVAGLVNIISDMSDRLNNLDKNYLNS